MTALYPWQRSVWQRFLNSKSQQKLAHAIVLTGVEGLAKHAFSQLMAKAALCLSPLDDGNACQQCHSCKLFAAGNHPDHIEIVPEEKGKQIKIEQIRDLKGKQQLTPTISNWKTVIISPAYSMNVNANNSLLKLLEEPEENTLLILVTSKPEVMPITVKSRCQELHIPAPDKQETFTWLQQNYPDITPSESTEQLLTLAKGAPFKLVDMLENDHQQQLTQINTDFTLLLRSEINPVQLAASWLQYDLTILMGQLYRTFHQRLVDKSAVAKKDELTAKERVSWAIVDCIVATTKLISSQNNLNKQLLLERFLVEISAIVANKVR